MIPATFDFEFAASIAAITLTGVILLIGWLTRTLAVVWLSVALGVLWSLAIAVGIAYRLDGGKTLEQLDIVVFRLLAAMEVVLWGVAVWISIKLWQRRLSAPSQVENPVPPSPEPGYDRDWLLSLLQSRVADSSERVAKTGVPRSGLDSSPLLPN